MWSWSLAILTTIISAEVLAAQPLPTSQNVRVAVERSLPYIEKVATAWMRDAEMQLLPQRYLPRLEPQRGGCPRI